MADDNVPLPYPDIKIAQWHYQMNSVPRLKEEASSSFWKAVEADGEPIPRWFRADINRDGTISEAD